MKSSNRVVLAAGHTLLLAASLAACYHTQPAGGPSARQAPSPSTARPGGIVVAPAGAPYTYRIPVSWVPAVRDAAAPGYLTSVGPALGTAHVDAVVSVEVMHPATTRQARELSQVSKDDPAQLRTADGWTVSIVDTPAGQARQVTYRTGDGPGGRYYFFDRPAARPVFVLCQWYADPSATTALQGCDQVVDTLTIER